MDISSLIDVSFLLLIYFLITSTLRKEEVDLPIVLPAQIPNENPDPVDPISVKVEPDGSVTYDGQPLIGAPPAKHSPKQMDPLVERLKEYRVIAEGSGSKAIVLVAADDNGKHQRLTDVLNAVNKAGIKNLTMNGFREEDE